MQGSRVPFSSQNSAIPTEAEYNAKRAPSFDVDNMLSGGAAFGVNNDAGPTPYDNLRTPSAQTSPREGQAYGPGTAPAPQNQALPTQRTAPNTLLPGNTSPGGTPPVPSTPNAPAAAGGPQAALGMYGAMPTLANGQSGMGPRILAALNPTAGSNA
jgi:hypothetical protein